MSETHRGNDQYNKYQHEISLSLAELQSQKKVTEDELEDIRLKLDGASTATHAQFRTLERSILDIRDMARDALHISTGVDGKNGLRGSLEGLVRDVTSMAKDLEFVRQSANSYIEMKSLILRFFAASVIAFLLQFGSGVWYLSAQHSQQEVARNDLNKVLAYIDKNPTEHHDKPASK